MEALEDIFESVCVVARTAASPCRLGGGLRAQPFSSEAGKARKRADSVRSAGQKPERGRCPAAFRALRYISKYPIVGYVMDSRAAPHGLTPNEFYQVR